MSEAVRIVRLLYYETSQWYSEDCFILQLVFIVLQTEECNRTTEKLLQNKKMQKLKKSPC